MNCEQLAQYDSNNSEKDAEIVWLKARLAALGSPEHAPDVITPSLLHQVQVSPHPLAPQFQLLHFQLLTHYQAMKQLPLLLAYQCLLQLLCVPASSSAVTPAVIFVSSYTGPTPTVTHIVAGAASGTVPGMTISCAGVSHRGKAPPVDAYTGENVEVRFGYWLPILDCAVSRNAWTDEESLIQHAGHWRGRAPQEWNLLGEEKKGTYQTAIQALRIQLDPGNRVLAAQDFRQAVQKDGKSVADYVRRLERYFQ